MAAGEERQSRDQARLSRVSRVSRGPFNFPEPVPLLDVSWDRVPSPDRPRLNLNLLSESIDSKFKSEQAVPVVACGRRAQVGNDGEGSMKDSRRLEKSTLLGEARVGSPW